MNSLKGNEKRIKWKKKRLVTIVHEEVVRFNEVDSYRIVHNMHYFNYFDIGRTYFVNLLLRHGSFEEVGGENDKYSFLVLTSQCRYKHFAKFNDRLQIETSFKYDPCTKSALFELNHRIKALSTRKIVAEGSTELGVCNDRRELLYNLPDELSSKLEGRVDYYMLNPKDIIRVR